MLENSPLNHDQKTQVEIATGSADTLMRLLNDILDFSKIESGKLGFESITFALPGTITEVVALLRARAAEKRLDLSLRLPADMPGHVLGDAVRLKQVPLNLTGNAIKFTEHGRIEIGVRVLHRDDKVATHITVESTLNVGAEFSFDLTLPLSLPPARPATAAPAQHPRSLVGRLLVVEDDRVNQRVIELLLKKLGIESVIVADGASAVEVAVFEHWDAVLMDCQMPGMDGFEATRQIRAQLEGKPLPIIALTANAMAGDREACVAAGMDDFIAKPVRQEELRACLERWLPVKVG